MKMRTLNEAAAELGTAREKLRRGIAAGKYPAMRWGNRYLVDIEALAPILKEEAARQNMVGISACAEQLGLSVDVLRRMTRSGLIPYERKGRNYRYRIADVKAALQSQMKPKK